MERLKWIKNHNANLQFWGYELGDIMAAIAGVGGFVALNRQFSSGFSTENTSDTIVTSNITYAESVLTWLLNQPDLVVTISIAFIVLVSPVASAISLSKYS